MFVLSTGENGGSLRNAVSNQFLLAIIAFRLFVPCAMAKNLVNVYVILRVAYRLFASSSIRQTQTYLHLSRRAILIRRRVKTGTGTSH